MVKPSFQNSPVEGKFVYFSDLSCYFQLLIKRIFIYITRYFTTSQAEIKVISSLLSFIHNKKPGSLSNEPGFFPTLL
ncbi:hypothetical protein KR50_32750 [Jeotgalibacillus campisalis]|uniref:Uncharacterized protein n=1 Tax=Jeotgalibacillus campisalis TaxID=220754 RepID=A0A0C2VGV9_9BACL|nr:hypothetical protein KR50_32750 [Jeotgalibacillus campisalis]